MREYCFEELGYFTAGDIHRIAAKLNGKTFMRFKVGYSSCAGNCTLIVYTDYEAPEAEIKAMFLHAALETLANG